MVIPSSISVKFGTLPQNEQRYEMASRTTSDSSNKPTAAIIGAAAVVVAAMITAGWFTSCNSPSISGQVREEHTEVAIPYAQISLVGRSETAVTDSFGNFHLSMNKPLPEEREVKLTAEKTGFERREVNTHVPERNLIIHLLRVSDAAVPPPSEPRQNDNVNAHPIFVDFHGRPSGGPTPGCTCGGKDIVFPGGPYTVNANEEFIFRYEDSPICRGQGFDNFHGVILWDGTQSTQMANNNDNGQYPGIAGSLQVKYPKPGDYNVIASFSLDCLDVACRNTCAAQGATQVHVR